MAAVNRYSFFGEDLGQFVPLDPDVDVAVVAAVDELLVLVRLQ